MTEETPTAPVTECGFCEQGERPIREWSSRAMFHRTLGWEKCPHCDGTGLAP